MFKKLFFLFLLLSIALSACGTLEVSLDQTPTPAVDAGQVATMVAATLAAIPSATVTPEPTATSTPEAPSVLPRSLYYSAPDANGKHQIYRLGRDGVTITQITFEIEGTGQFDVSPMDGMLAYETKKQIVAVKINGADRHVLVNQISTFHDVLRLRWSPDGRTLAYNNDTGLYFYSPETGISALILGNNGDGLNYWPGDFSPDGQKLFVTVIADKIHKSAIYDVTSHTITFFKASPPLTKLFFDCSPTSWSIDSKYLYMSEWIAAGGVGCIRQPGLWRFDKDGISTALLPIQAADGSSIFNKTAAPRQDTAGNLIYLFSPAETGIDSYAPFSLVRTDADGISDRVVLRPETFHVTDTSLWTPDGSAIILIQNDGKSNRFLNLVLVPVDPSLPVMTLLADASTLSGILRWGP